MGVNTGGYNMTEEAAHLLGLHREACPDLCAICSRDKIITTCELALANIARDSGMLGYDAGDSGIYELATTALKAVQDWRTYG